MILASCDDFRRAAQRRLPRFLFDLDGGANHETTLVGNIRDLQDISLEQRVLRDVVSQMLEHFAQEIRIGMALTGVRAIDEIDRSILASAPGVPCNAPGY